MANTTIYPYGTNGLLPDSIGIIDDLTTGGSNNALSAELGKKLNNVNLHEIDYPIMGFARSGTASSKNYRKMLFDDIKFLDISTRNFYDVNTTNGYEFYSHTLFTLAADSENYITIGPGSSANTVCIKLYKGGSVTHTSSNSGDTVSTLGLANYNIAFDFISKRVMFTKCNRSGTTTGTYVVDMSEWDFSGLEGKLVYFSKSFYFYHSCYILYCFVKVNHPNYNTISIKTYPYSILGSFTYFPYSESINRSNLITGLNNYNLTITETISSTHKKFSCSKTSADYLSFFPQGGFISTIPLIFGVKFKLLSGTPTIVSGGQADITVIKPDGTFANIIGFTFETGTEYTLVSDAVNIGKYTAGAAYHSNYAIRGYGTFECEVYNPFIIIPQHLLIGSETLKDNIFCGNIPFSASGVSLVPYKPAGTAANSYIYYHTGELKYENNNVYIWNGTAWKQINNA